MQFEALKVLRINAMAALVLTAMANGSMAAGDFPDAAASDPNTLGLMQGFPPPPDKRVMQPDSNFFSFPKLRWTVCHIRELMPTKQVSRGLGAPVPLDYALDDGIDAVTFTPIGGDKPMTWKESLGANYTDGLLIMHKGKVVYEYYTGCLNEAGKHAAMSMTKSMTGLLAQILVAEGERQSEILRAEGEKQAAILEAEGRKEAAFRDAEARERQAEAEARATHMVSQAIEKGNVNAINYFVATKYVEALQQIATSPNEKLVLMPLEASSVIGAIGGIAELAKDAMQKNTKGS